MSHSLRAKLSGLRYKGILEDKDYKRLCHALDLEKAEQKPCDRCGEIPEEVTMTREEIIEQLENTIGLIKQDGKDWLDDRDIPMLEECVKALLQVSEIEENIIEYMKKYPNHVGNTDFWEGFYACRNVVLQLDNEYSPKEQELTSPCDLCKFNCTDICCLNCPAMAKGGK